jgi:hypothetical protein
MTKGEGKESQDQLSFEIRHSLFDIRYCMKMYPVWFRLRRVR